MPLTLAVSEIFGPVLQGEGPVIGEPTVFVRLGGCDYRCHWCDSLHAVMPEHRAEWKQMIAEEVMERVSELAPCPRDGFGGGMLVTLSGGNPAMQPCGPLVEVGQKLGYRFCVETQGSIAPAWLRIVDVVVLSPKPPSSGMFVSWVRFARCVAAATPRDASPRRLVALKVPVFGEADLDWVENELLRRYALPLWLSVGNPFPPADSSVSSLSQAEASLMGVYPRGALDRREEIDALRKVLLERYAWLAEEVVRRRLPARITPQMHVLVHGNERQR